MRPLALVILHPLFAHAPRLFDGRGGELTHVLDTPFDPHPNDAGYRVIADAFIDVLKTGP